MVRLLLISVVTLLTAGSGNCARILAFQTCPAKSHHIVVRPLFEELAARGHQLTVFSCFTQDPPLPNIRDINICTKLSNIFSSFSYANIKEVMPNLFFTPLSMVNYEHHVCDTMYNEEPIQNLLKSNEKFDLVITETFANDCFAPFAKKFKAPLISYTTSSFVPWLSDRVGLPDNPSYIPNYLVALSTHMNLFQRMYSTIVLTYAKLFHQFYIVPKTQSLVTKYFGDYVPPMQNILRNTSLVLVNGHFSLYHSRPFPPNVIEIGGIHITNSSEPISKDIQHILDKSTQGVILVSFGSLIQTSSIPPEIIQILMKAFATIPQTVIFKYESSLPGAPNNVILKKWLPQRKILAHPNVKALFAHGGLASTIEAVHFGKPLVGIPFFGDQYNNVKALEHHGAGIMIDQNHLSEDKIKTALQEVIQNPMYSDNMRRLSLRFRDRPMSALQSAVFWTEYVIRHQGAPHLQPASVHLPLYQYLLLDVLAVLLLPLLLVLCIIYTKAAKGSPNNYIRQKSKKE